MDTVVKPKKGKNESSNVISSGGDPRMSLGYGPLRDITDISMKNWQNPYMNRSNALESIIMNDEIRDPNIEYVEMPEIEYEEIVIEVPKIVRVPKYRDSEKSPYTRYPISPPPNLQKYVNSGTAQHLSRMTQARKKMEARLGENEFSDLKPRQIQRRPSGHDIPRPKQKTRTDLEIPINLLKTDELVDLLQKFPISNRERL